jgi:SAM-dependent methyltransferase
MPPTSDPTRRFTDRVENYTRYRPHYPAEVIDVLRDDTGLTPSAIVADVGSGTGISTELFLRNGNRVYAVEPNGAMRSAAEERLGDREGFTSVDGTAEQTTLPAHSVDYVVAGQAFHWFDAARARAEFARIIKAGGWVVLMWNDRRADSTAFSRDYEALLRRFGTDYEAVRHRTLEAASLGSFFEDGIFLLRSLPNEQRLDLPALKGRLLSSSYAPAAGHPEHLPMLDELERAFARHQEDGHVRMEYDTKLFIGHVA